MRINVPYSILARNADHFSFYCFNVWRLISGISLVIPLIPMYATQYFACVCLFTRDEKKKKSFSCTTTGTRTRYGGSHVICLYIIKYYHHPSISDAIAPLITC